MEMNSAKGRLRLLYYALAYVLLATIIGELTYRVGGAEKYQRLAQSHLSARAVIEWTQCDNHGRYLYAFTVDGRNYSGFSHGATEKPCRELRKGDELEVFYLSTDPSTNTDGDPAARYSNEVISSTVAALVIPGFIVFGLLRALAGIEAEDRKFFQNRKKSS